jgi:hypothetical protein
MSQETVELQQRLMDAFNRRDLSTCLALMDEDVEAVWQVARWRRGRIFWWAHFDTRAEAFEAAGLSDG